MVVTRWRTGDWRAAVYLSRGNRVWAGPAAVVDLLAENWQAKPVG